MARKILKTQSAEPLPRVRQWRAKRARLADPLRLGCYASSLRSPASRAEDRGNPLNESGSTIGGTPPAQTEAR